MKNQAISVVTNKVVHTAMSTLPNVYTDMLICMQIDLYLSEYLFIYFQSYNNQMNKHNGNLQSDFVIFARHHYKTPLLDRYKTPLYCSKEKIVGFVTES